MAVDTTQQEDAVMSKTFDRRLRRLLKRILYDHVSAVCLTIVVVHSTLLRAAPNIIFIGPRVQRHPLRELSARCPCLESNAGNPSRVSDDLAHFSHQF